MSVFKLPKKLCMELERVIRDFWWGQQDGKRKIHRTKWEKLCEPNGSGGLGFRDLIKFNAALLAKQGWRLTNNDMSLFYRVFKSKYFPDCSWLEENPKQRGSYAWQSIMSSRHVVLKGSRWRVMSLNNKRYLVVRVKGCRSSRSCVFKRQCESIFKKGVKWIWFMEIL
jgi:hypothetical protein